MDAYAWFTYTVMAGIFGATAIFGRRGKTSRKRCLFQRKPRKKSQATAVAIDNSSKNTNCREADANKAQPD